MKKFSMYIIAAIVIVSCAFGVYKITSKFRIGILTDNIDCNIVLKGCQNAKGLTMIGNNTYVAFEDSVIEVDQSGREKIVFKNKESVIEDIEGLDNYLYILANDKIIKYSLSDNKSEEIIKDIPSKGSLLERKLLLIEDKLYLSISSTTNDGISNEDNKAYDVPPYEIILGEGVKSNLAPFRHYGIGGKIGEKIKGEHIGNNSVYSIDLKSNEKKLVATGIKKVVGWDYNSKNKVYIAVQGINDGGIRKVVRDRDYIYELENDTDYGFPDFSGGDPITSPRFSEGESVKQLLNSSNKKNIPSPIYQHSSVGSLEGFAIDRNGSVFQKDTNIFYDKKERVIGTLSPNGVYTRVLKLNENSNINEIKYYNDNIYILDSGVGCLYQITNRVAFLGFNLEPIVWIVLLSILLVILMIVVMKIIKKNKA
ncbi:MAG: hypothetical protein ACRC7N_13140 [Clostridium sp.]